MKQSSEERALYYRQIRQSLHNVLRPELTSAQANDTVALIDRLLAEFIVEEEAGSALSATYGQRLAALVDGADGATDVVIGPVGFADLERRAAQCVANSVGDNEAMKRDLPHALFAVERDFFEEVDALRQQVLSEELRDGEPVTDNGCSITNEELTAYLRERFSDDPDGRVVQATVIPGGRSKETILVKLEGFSHLPEEIIVRKDRPVGLLETRAADEYAVIKAVFEYGGVAIPEPFFAEESSAMLGAGTALVMARVQGTKAGEFFPDLAQPSEYRVEIGRDIAANLARLHSLPLERLGDAGLDPSGAEVTNESVLGAVDAMAARITELSGPALATVPLARQWLHDHVDDVVPANRSCLLQGDFGFHNMLIDGPNVTALVDWEAATIGPPARELASAWNAATSLMPWSQFVAAYTAGGGVPKDADPRAVNYYRVFLALGGLMTSKTGGHLFRSGTKRDLLTAHSGLDSFFRCARNLVRALADAMATDGRTAR